jgi:hypothetical protein
MWYRLSEISPISEVIQLVTIAQNVSTILRNQQQSAQQAQQNLATLLAAISDIKAQLDRIEQDLIEPVAETGDFNPQRATKE